VETAEVAKAGEGL